MLGVAIGTLIPSIVFRGIIQPIVVERLLHISVRATALVYLRTGLRCAACLVLPLLITRFWLRPTYPHLLFVAILSAVVYVLPVWWLEFDLVGADRVMGPIRSASRLLFAR
jgi:hypothetical protein